jgi:DNA-binding transcriptional ArsR family regulator
MSSMNAVPQPTDAVFRALADPTRREILQLLAVRAAPVHQLSERFNVSRPAISRHLRLLKEAELVELCPDGRRNVYRLHARNLREVQAWLGSLWGKRLSKLKALAQQEWP